jgi:signal peptidase II
VFNVADPAVVGGAMLLVVLSVFGYDFDRIGRRAPDGSPDPVHTAAPDSADSA